MFCLNKNLADVFLNKLKSGSVNPDQLAKMASKDRRSLFKTIIGKENAEEVNALFEKNILLKDQKKAMVNWAKQVTGLKPEAQKDLVTRINKMDKILDPENEMVFLNDLASHKLGVTVTFEEASMLSKLAKEVSIKKDAIENGGDRLEYGMALVEFKDFVSNLKNESGKITVEDIKAKPLEIGGKAIGQAIVNVAGIAKSLKASLDNSVIGRQGLKTLFSNPDIWLKNSAKSFVDIYKILSGKEALNMVRAEVLSRPNALNGLYKKEGLAIEVQEEAYPSTFPENIPVFGRFFKASQGAFTAWQYRTRADVFDRYVDIAEKYGADITGIGKVVTSLTGRGTFGQRYEAAASAANNLFFSPRFLKSNIDLLTIHALDKDIGGFARAQAAYNLLGTVVGVATVLAIADAVFPGSVEWDPRSSDFGQIKVGKTRFNVTGGIGAIVVLASRLLSGSTKSKGRIKPLNSGKFGSMTKLDVIYNFFEGKLSPVASVMKTILEGKDYKGDKPTLTSLVADLAVPIPITNYFELQQPDAAPTLWAILADEFGIGTNTY